MARAMVDVKNATAGDGLLGVLSSIFIASPPQEL